MAEGEKWCSRCRELHPLSMFYRSQYTKTGYRSECRRYSSLPYLRHIPANAEKFAVADSGPIQDERLVIDALIGAHGRECCWLIPEIVLQTGIPENRVIATLTWLVEARLVHQSGELYEPDDKLIPGSIDKPDFGRSREPKNKMAARLNRAA